MYSAPFFLHSSGTSTIHTLLAIYARMNERESESQPMHGAFTNSLPPKRKLKIDLGGMMFHSMEQTVSTVVTVARVAVTVAGFMIVIFSEAWLVRGLM